MVEMARFRTKARAVDLLGKQQIRDEVTAITELLRNAYDADADVGLIDVNTTLDRIIVWDDGDGMSREDVENKWLTLGTYSKMNKGTRISRKGRVKIGEKGIGRLAISLLGNQNLLISKDRDTGHWTILYLHWDLFRNQSIYLEDISLPIKTFPDYKVTVEYLNNHIEDLKAELIANLLNDDSWDEKDINEISLQINNFHLTKDFYKYLKQIESKGKGTLFYINNIENTWDWSIYSSQIKENNLVRRERRLKDVLYSFQNLFEIFEIEDIKEVDHFQPRIHIDGVRLEDETWFNKDDLELFDYALIGKISKGIFEGKTIVKGPDGTKNFPVNIDVTIGIHNVKESDCGDVDIKWFFVEGRDYNSILEKEQHKMILEKLDEVGGIYVFRDGLRILPYGEPGNDFLYMEERRSKRATTYLFSHRRMFGYMGISKENNPNLIDKSSREGFVENKQFSYFQTTAINLLIWWAKDFLETNDSATGKRLKRIEAIKQVRKEELRANEIKKQEEQLEKEYYNSLERKIDTFESTLNLRIINIESNLKNILSEYISSIEKVKTKSNLSNITINAKEKAKKVINSLDELVLIVNNRFNHTIQILEEINDKNEKLENIKLEIYKKFDRSILQQTEQILSKLQLEYESQINEDEKIKLLNLRIDEAIGAFSRLSKT